MKKYIVDTNNTKMLEIYVAV